MYICRVGNDTDYFFFICNRRSIIFYALLIFPSWHFSPLFCPTFSYRILLTSCYLFVIDAHVLDTLNVGDGEASKDTSVHLTVGVDTHIWGLNFASLRDSSFKRSGLNDKVLLTKLDDALYWELQVNDWLSCFY